MVREDFIKKQVKRLAGYHGFEGFKDELLRVLKEYAANEQHAERVITRIIDTRRPIGDAFVVSCPTPAELIDYVGQIPANLTAARGPDPDCRACHGSGWKITERNGLSGAARCGCLESVAA